MRTTRLLAVFAVLLVGLTPISAIALNPTFELISPFSKEYVFGTDYKLFIELSGIFPSFPSAPGDVTADLQFVGLGIVDNDFAGFVSGNIALIERGTLVFSGKVNNAASFGAVGAIIFDNTNVFQDATLVDQTFIPSIFTTDIVGAELLGLIAQGPVVVHLEIPAPEPIPEPATILLLGSGLIGLIGFGRKKFIRK